jgi:hypothetical protein
VLYIQSGARQDIAFHLPRGQMSEVLPSQKSDLLLVLIRAALVGKLVQPETVATEGSDEFVPHRLMAAKSRCGNGANKTIVVTAGIEGVPATAGSAAGTAPDAASMTIGS